MMAFLSLEDLVGTVEVIVFPRDYEKTESIWRLIKNFCKGKSIRGRGAAEQADL